MTMSVPTHLDRSFIGPIFLVSLISLATVLATPGAIYSDALARGELGAAVIIAILFRWSITKEEPQTITGRFTTRTLSTILTADPQEDSMLN